MIDYAKETGSTKANYIVKDWENTVNSFKKYIPISMITVGEESFAQK
jgi:glutamate synthase domain-containing protein 3